MYSTFVFLKKSIKKTSSRKSLRITAVFVRLYFQQKIHDNSCFAQHAFLQLKATLLQNCETLTVSLFHTNE